MGRMRRFNDRVRDVISYEGGNIAEGVRRVRKGGRIKFDSFWHQDDLLIPFVGQWVRCSAEDCFFNRQIPVYHYHGGFICYANNEYKGQ